MSATRRLLDLWMPPEQAGTPLACLSTTFTFEADFFEQQCLGRFLGFDTRPGEVAGDLAFLIEREQKLDEVDVCVIADRSLDPDARSLRWDLLTVTGHTGVMHAKVTVLVWEHVVRLIVTSANLAEKAYRRSLELALAFDAHQGADVERSIFDELIDRLDRVLALPPRSRAANDPRTKAAATLTLARERIAAFSLRDRPRRGAPVIAPVMPDRDGDAIDGLMGVWRGGPPRLATVMSPFFDATPGASRAGDRIRGVLAQRGPTSARFVVPVERLNDAEIARVPAALREAFPARVETSVHDIDQPDQREPRTLHGKLVLLESQEWCAALVGSSNFTAAGLGLGGGGNVEIGVAIGADAGSEVAGELVKLALVGPEVDVSAVECEPEADPDESGVAVPLGFVAVLGEPGPPAVLQIELDAARLPGAWSIAIREGDVLLDSDAWEQAGSDDVATVTLPNGELPFNVTILWHTEEGALQRGSLPVNVTDQSALPQPEKLRDLPVDVLLKALASSRPLHEAIEAIVVQREDGRATADELDPHKRFSPAGQLMFRARQISAALAGLRDRLERPAPTLKAFECRCSGAFGPLAIAEKLTHEDETDNAIEGEGAFMVAEVALTVAAVDIDRVSRFVPERRQAFEAVRRSTLEQLRERAEAAEARGELGAYVEAALGKAMR